jgi:transcriptional regulator with XRE-family HTH domain
MTQQDLGAKAGVHWTTIGKIERGRQMPSLALLAVLARAKVRRSHLRRSVNAPNFPLPSDVL